jgi:hypothetical protein
MLYTFTTPGESYDRIRLFPDPDAARALATEARRLQIVAVGYDARMRRVIPLWTDPTLFDPTWTAPAQSHPDGSVTAKGPIPSELFLV